MLKVAQEKSDGWTEERITLLKRLWLEGLSASQIANILGQGVTRNAIVGKVHRLKLEPRETVVKKARTTTPRPASQTPRFGRKPAGKKKPPMPLEVIEKVVAQESKPIASEDPAPSDESLGLRLDYSLAHFSRKGLIDSYRGSEAVRSIVVGDRGPQLPPEEKCNFMSAGAAGSRCIHRREKKRPYCTLHRDFQVMATGVGSSLNGTSQLIKP